MKMEAVKTKKKSPHKHGDRRTIKRFAFWPTKVVDNQGGYWTIWLESYYKDQQYYSPEYAFGPGTDYWYTKKKYII